MANTSIASRKVVFRLTYLEFFVDTWYSIGRPNTDSFGRPIARFSRLASTIYGRTGKRGILIIWQCWRETSPKTPPPHLPARPFNISGGKHNWFNHFPKDSNSNFRKTNKNHERSMQKESWKSGRQETTSYTFWGYKYSRSESSQCRERIASASSICGRVQDLATPMDTKLFLQKQDCTR